MLERLAAQRDDQPIWVDSLEYCQTRILRHEPLPWHNPSELGDFFAKMDGLFSSDAILFDLGRAYNDLISALPGVRTDMGERHRPGYALKVMLGDASVRSRVLDAVLAVAAVATSRKRNMVISIPSPQQWLRTAGNLASQLPQVMAPLDPRQVETGAIYLADNLRTLAALAVDAIVIYEEAKIDGTVDSLEPYRPILNIAAHYGWPVLHRSDLEGCWCYDAVVGIAASLGRFAPVSTETRPWGVVSELSGTVNLSARHGAPAVLVVPREADPNDVTSWMSTLR